ncbi:TetR/AcrR family transcriptional regulator, partial [Klebsiella pneumoniae]|nr:TetR/AcrR family transcriptional regulator [Klebsiella pneumoniae]
MLEAAARILESLGFAGFNTNAVAELAGVSIGSLYQYFPSKDALIVELIRRERAKLSTHIVEAIQQNDAADLK